MEDITQAVTPSMEVTAVHAFHMSDLMAQPLPASNVCGEQHQGEGHHRRGLGPSHALGGPLPFLPPSFLLLPLSSLCLSESQCSFRLVLYFFEAFPDCSSSQPSSVSFFIGTENVSDREEDE